MSDIQKLINAIADELTVMSADMMKLKLCTIANTLDGISSYYHKDAVLAAFAVKEEENA